MNFKNLMGGKTVRRSNLNKVGDSRRVKDSEATDIRKAKNKLIKKAQKRGIYENFGQDEVRDLQDKYGYTDAIREFDDWCMNYDGHVYDSRRVKDSLDEDEYEEYLNELGEGLDEDEFIIGGEKRNMPYGTALRKYDPVAFNVGFDEWEREMEDDKEQFLGQIANQLEEGYHSGYDPQWDIDITVDGRDISEFNDDDKDLIYQDIAYVVKDGYDNYMDIETELSDGSIVYVDFTLNY